MFFTSKNIEFLYLMRYTVSVIFYRRTGYEYFPDTGAARALRVFGDTAYGVSEDIPQPVICCDIFAESLIFLAASKEPMD